MGSKGPSKAPQHALPGFLEEAVGEVVSPPAQRCGQVPTLLPVDVALLENRVSARHDFELR